MPRSKGDGRGRLGGRAPGTPNKEKPLKVLLRQHSLKYYTPDPDTGLSEFDEDLSHMMPADRAHVELNLLNYHTPKMQATTVDMNTDAKQSFSEQLSQIAKDND